MILANPARTGPMRVASDICVPTDGCLGSVRRRLTHSPSRCVLADTVVEDAGAQVVPTRVFTRTLRWGGSR
jgi:hypothetical protein